MYFDKLVFVVATLDGASDVKLAQLQQQYSTACSELQQMAAMNKALEQELANATTEVILLLTVYTNMLQAIETFAQSFFICFHEIYFKYILSTF